MIHSCSQKLRGQYHENAWACLDYVLRITGKICNEFGQMPPEGTEIAENRGQILFEHIDHIDFFHYLVIILSCLSPFQEETITIEKYRREMLCAVCILVHPLLDKQSV